MRVEVWAERRFKRRIEARDTTGAMRAALLYQTVSGLLHRDALGEVTGYDD
jgi:hypothetical protein